MSDGSLSAWEALRLNDQMPEGEGRTVSWTKEETEAHRKLWTDALRSGDYNQSKFQLRNDVEKLDAEDVEVIAPVGFCCLGVACDVALKAGAIDAYKGHHMTLPEDVIDWLGLSGSGGDTEVPRTFYGDGSASHFYSLWELNDDADYSFEQIADVIDAGLVRLAGDKS